MSALFPTNVKDLIYSSDQTKQTIDSIVKDKDGFPSFGTNTIILHGPTGTGKSRCANLLPHCLERVRGNDILRDFRFEDCSSPNNGLKLLSSLKKTAKTASVNTSRLQYIIIDEAGNLKPDAMAELHILLNSKQAIFIMATNILDSFTDTVKSRSKIISFSPSTPDVWLPLARETLAHKGVPDPQKVDDAFLRLQILNAGNNGRGVIAVMQDIAPRIAAAQLAKASAPTSTGLVRSQAMP